MTRIAREPGEHRRLGLDADAGMEEKQRPSVAALDHFNPGAVDQDYGATVCHGLLLRRLAALTFSGNVTGSSGRRCHVGE